MRKLGTDNAGGRNGIAEILRCWQLKEKHSRLKQLVTAITLEKLVILLEVFAKKDLKPLNNMCWGSSSRYFASNGAASVETPVG